MNRLSVRLCLVLAVLVALPACDNAADEDRGEFYSLRLLGTAETSATCTINLETPEGVDSATFASRPIPDEATLGTVLSATVVCTKDQEIGRLRLELFQNGIIVDTDETEEAFGSAIVSHP